MQIVDTFQNRLKHAMKIRNVKQVDLVEKTKLDKTLINKYLAGVSNARQRKLTILADALDVNEVWLMGYDVPMERKLNEPQNNIKDLKNSELNTLDIDGLDENDIEEIKALIEFKKSKKNKQ